MSLAASFDEYEIKARYIPVFISFVPLVHALILFVGDSFFGKLMSDMKWMLFSNVSVTLIITLAFLQIQCILGKHWIEESVFGKGGENFPTTDSLLYNGNLISQERKEQIRRKISGKFGCKFTSKEEENANLQNARLQAREAVNFVRGDVGNGSKTLGYNIRYGFVRNFIAGIIWAGIGSLLCFAYYSYYEKWANATFFIMYFVIYLFVFLYKKRILNKLAYSYADSLFNDFLNMREGK